MANAVEHRLHYKPAPLPGVLQVALAHFLGDGDSRAPVGVQRIPVAGQDLAVDDLQILFGHIFFPINVLGGADQARNIDQDASLAPAAFLLRTGQERFMEKRKSEMTKFKFARTFSRP